MKRLFLATIGCVLLLTGCYKDDIWQMHKEIDSLRDVKVASLSEQAESIRTSITDLDEMSISLQEFIKALENSKSSVETQLVSIQDVIAAFRQSSSDEI